MLVRSSGDWEDERLWFGWDGVLDLAGFGAEWGGVGGVFAQGVAWVTV